MYKNFWIRYNTIFPFYNTLQEFQTDLLDATYSVENPASGCITCFFDRVSLISHAYWVYKKRLKTSWTDLTVRLLIQRYVKFFFVLRASKFKRNLD